MKCLLWTILITLHSLLKCSYLPCEGDPVMTPTVQRRMRRVKKLVPRATRQEAVGPGGAPESPPSSTTCATSQRRPTRGGGLGRQPRLREAWKPVGAGRGAGLLGRSVCGRGGRSDPGPPESAPQPCFTLVRLYSAVNPDL